MGKIPESVTRAVTVEANEWLARLSEDATDATNDAFAEWLRRSPIHVREYLRAEATWLLLERAASGGELDVDALLHEDDSNVVEFTRTHRPPDRAARTGRRRFLAAVAASGLSAAFLGGFWHYTRADVFETGVGEQRRVVLEDGSWIELNTRSAVAVRMTEDIRQIELIRGEAFFKVAKDVDRPFVVTSDVAVVQALGTAFNVYRQSQKTVVTVLEGRVSVADTDSRPDDQAAPHEEQRESIALGTGEQAEVAKQAPIRRAAVDPLRAVTWRERRLVFDNQPLADVLAEFNRYNVQQMTISDPALAATRVSGVFDADKPEALLKFLAQNAVIQPVVLTGFGVTIEPRH